MQRAFGEETVSYRSPRWGGAVSQQVVTALSGFALIICCLANDSKLSGVISVAVVAIYAVYAIRKQRDYFFLYAALLFAVFANIIGCAVAEYFPVYLSEIRAYSSFCGSLPLLVLSRWAFLAVLLHFGDCFGRKAPIQEWMGDSASKVVAMVVLAALLFMLVMTVRNPPSFVVGMDRFAYASAFNNSSVYRMLTNAMPYLIFVIIAATRWGMKLLGWAGVVAWAIILVWTGTKFGGFFNLVCAFMIVYCDRLSCLREGAARVFSVLIIVVMAGLIAVSAIVYGTYGTGTGADFLFARTAQQGQIWWATYEKADGAFRLDRVEGEILGAVNDGGSIAGNKGSTHGIYGMMYLNAPTDLVDGKLAQGSRYTEGGYAAMYYSGGLTGVLLFSLTMSGIFFFVIRGLGVALKRGRAIEVVMLARLFIVLQTALSMGTFADLIDPVSLGSYAYLIFSSFLRARGDRPCFLRMPCAS